MSSIQSHYFVPSELIKKICFIDCENTKKSLNTFHEYPLMEDTFVYLFYSSSTGGYWQKIQEEDKANCVSIKAKTSGKNVADGLMILHVMRLHMILPNRVMFYLISNDTIFAETAIQISIQGRICEFLPRTNIGYYLYLQKNILLPETTFEKTLRLARDTFSIKSSDDNTLLFLKQFLKENNIESTYWTVSMLSSELIRRNGQNIQKKDTKIDKDFEFELNLVLEKLRKFIACISSQISLSVIGQVLQEESEFIEKNYGKLTLFLSDEHVKRVIQAEIQYRKDGVLVLKRRKHFQHLFKGK